MVDENFLDDEVLCPLSSLPRVYHGRIHDTDDTIQIFISFGKKGIDITVTYAHVIRDNITLSDITFMTLEVDERRKIISPEYSFAHPYYIYSMETLRISLDIGTRSIYKECCCSDITCEHPTPCTKSTDPCADSRSSCDCNFNVDLAAIVKLALNCGYAVTRNEDGNFNISLPVAPITSNSFACTA